MAVLDLYVDNVLRERRDDDTRTFSAWDAAGTLTTSRPYTTAENADADARATAATASANGATLRTRAANAIATNNAFLAQTTWTNADVLAQVKLLTRECNALIRLVVNQLDSTDG